MRLAAVDYHFRGRDDTERFLQARQLGLDGVEVMVWNDELLTPAQNRLDQMIAAKVSSGLQICSLLMAGYNTELGIAWPDPAVAARASEGVRRAIDWAAKVGAGVVLVPFFVDTEIRNSDDFYRVGDAFRQICPYAAAHSVILGFESTLAADDVLKMIDYVSEDGFGCYFDIGNTAFQAQDAVIEIYKLGHHIKQVHVKDTRVFPGDCRLGQGLVDLAGSAQALRESGYDGWLVGEYTEFPNARGVPAPPLEVVARDVSFTRYVFPELRPRQRWPRLGASSSYWDRNELPDLIQTFVRSGLVSVQLGGALLDEALRKPPAIISIRSELEAAGLRVVGIEARGNLVSPDAGTRQATREHIKECLKIAPQLGASIVKMPSGEYGLDGQKNSSPIGWQAASWDLLCQAVEELSIVAVQYGSVMAFSVHCGHTVPTECQLLGLLDRFPSKYVRVCLDPYHNVSKPQMPAIQRVVARYLERFEPLSVMSSLRDVGHDEAQSDISEFGSREFPQKIYLEFLRMHSRDLPLVLETATPTSIASAVELLQLI